MTVSLVGILIVLGIVLYLCSSSVEGVSGDEP